MIVAEAASDGLARHSRSNVTVDHPVHPPFIVVGTLGCQHFTTCSPSSPITGRNMLVTRLHQEDPVRRPWAGAKGWDDSTNDGYHRPSFVQSSSRPSSPSPSTVRGRFDHAADEHRHKVGSPAAGQPLLVASLPRDHRSSLTTSASFVFRLASSFASRLCLLVYLSAARWVVLAGRVSGSSASSRLEPADLPRRACFSIGIPSSFHLQPQRSSGDGKKQQAVVPANRGGATLLQLPNSAGSRE